MTTLQDLEQRIDKIEERNLKVEGDKAWETSIARKLVVLVLTYLVVGLYLMTIEFPDPWINAIVPAIGFFLSTLTLGVLKDLWVSAFRKK
jgi:hypothetical protein